MMEEGRSELIELELLRNIKSLYNDFNLNKFDLMFNTKNQSYYIVVDNEGLLDNNLFLKVAGGIIFNLIKEFPNIKFNFISDKSFIKPDVKIN